MHILLFSILLYKRFFGRFAYDNAVHDEQTLKAIRENADGLRGRMEIK